MGIIVEIDERQAERLRALTHQDDLAAAVERAVRMLDGKTLGQLEAEARLEAMAPEERESERQRAWDALLGLSGMWDGPGDSADNHDHYIYDLEMP